MSEESELKRMGATPVKNSGRGTQKGDGKLGIFVVDVKEYETGFRVTRENWAKASSDARKHGIFRAMFWLALRPKGAPLESTTPIRLMVVDGDFGLEMLEAWEREQDGKIQD